MSFRALINSPKPSTDINEIQKLTCKYKLILKPFLQPNGEVQPVTKYTSGNEH